MTTYTHTPGPWTVENGPVESEMLAISAAGRTFQNPICLFDYGAGPALKWEPNREQCANARLIAAAPDMLAALKAVELEAVNAGRGGDVTIPSQVWDMISAAIARAEGGRP